MPHKQCCARLKQMSNARCRRHAALCRTNIFSSANNCCRRNNVACGKHAAKTILCTNVTIFCFAEACFRAHCALNLQIAIRDYSSNLLGALNSVPHNFAPLSSASELYAEWPMNPNARSWPMNKTCKSRAAISLHLCGGAGQLVLATYSQKCHMDMF